jgi:hypothetical protein
LAGGQRLPYVNDHDKRASENKADIDAILSLKQKGVRHAGKEPSERTSEKQFKISVENAKKLL